MRSSESPMEIEEIKKLILSCAEDIGKYIQQVDSETLNRVLNFYIFGSKGEYGTNEGVNKEANEEKKLLQVDNISPEDFESYKFQVGSFVLVTQIVIYHIFQENDARDPVNNQNLANLSQATTVTDIQKNFSHIQSRKHQTIFKLDIIPHLKNNALKSIQNLNYTLSQIDLAKFIQYDILGKLYHSFIPHGLRKTLAAYYTKYVVSKFAVEIVFKDKQIGRVFDPTCGSGTFLIASYQKIKEIDSNLSHNKILEKIYGNDITAFAVLLAAINLEIQNVVESIHHAQISKEDIFRVRISDTVSDKESHSPPYAIDPSQDSKDIRESVMHRIPKMDYIVGNPPFTRSERLPPPYLKKLRGHFKLGNQEQYIIKKMPLHGYILLDMERYLHSNGRIALVLPYSTLFIDKLLKVRRYLLENYQIEYLITSEVEPFSENTGLKEVILIAEKRQKLAYKEHKGKQGKFGHKIKFISLKTPLSLENFTSLSQDIQSAITDLENDLYRVKIVENQKLLNEFNDNWTFFFQHALKLSLYNDLRENPKICQTRDLENETIRVIRGFRPFFSNYWMVPNFQWDVSEEIKDGIVITNKIDTSLRLTFSKDFFIPSVSKSDNYKRPIIPKTDHYILRNNGSDRISDPNLLSYCDWFQSELGAEKHEKFVKQLIKIGKNFYYKGRISFPHRFDLTTGKIICYFLPNLVDLNQNWFTIKNLEDDLHEKLLISWFNSSVFLLSFLMTRRQQRGAFGQTAVGEMKKYLIPIRNTFGADVINQIYSQFQRFNDSALVNISLEKQIKTTLQRTNARKELDLLFLQYLEIEGIEEWLENCYRLIIQEIELMKQQVKN